MVAAIGHSNSKRAADSDKQPEIYKFSSAIVTCATGLKVIADVGHETMHSPH
jgi:hypothetical protein